MLKYIKKIYYVYYKFYCFFYCKKNKIELKLKKISFGHNLKMYNKIYLNKGEDAKITIGNNFTFSSGNCINPLSRNIRGCIMAYPKASITIGNNVGISSSCIWANSSITIGNYVNIGADSILMDTDAHSLNYLDRRFPESDKANKKDLPIIIEDDVLIGTRCIILKGVTIGARSIIGSGSVVTKSIPADCVAAGNPCKIIRYINENKTFN